MSKLLLITGNGFSLDFISQIGKDNTVDLRNLFKLGHTVNFPGQNIPGFLSHKWCPNLWLLGARPSQKKDESISIIEEIITCSNMLFDYLVHDNNRLKLRDPSAHSIYIKAYLELIVYLRHLFITYNNRIEDSDIDNLLSDNEWGWIQFLNKAKTKYEKIKIITYNYDIWLERILNKMDIEYCVGGLENSDKLVEIIKPHGSISFIPTSGKKDMYQISYSVELGDVEISGIKCAYTELDEYDKSFLIPPAGDSTRQSSNSWSQKLHKLAINTTKEMDGNDDVIFCGMSYWHVDRKELDELLININPDVNITIINPNLRRELNAVLVTLFKNFTVFTSSESLKEILP
jgi:hypothetical protein